MTLERKTKITKSPTEVRFFANDILLASRYALEIDFAQIQRLLVPTLIEFKKKQVGDENQNPYVRHELSPEQEVSLSLFFNAVNFCFRNPENKIDYSYFSPISGKTYKRSTGLFVALAESGIDWNNLTKVSSLSMRRWKELIQLDDTKNLYLGDERLGRITGFSKYIEKSGFINAFDWVRRDTKELLNNFAKSGFFKDEFQKRAQLTVKSVDGILRRRKGYGVHGVETLTCMADYRIPQVFYNLGIIKLSPILLEKLTSETIIQPNSTWELALRASVIVVGSQLAKLMGITEAEVDFLLWHLSQEMANDGKLTIPHMLVPTDKY